MKNIYITAKSEQILTKKGSGYQSIIYSSFIYRRIYIINVNQLGLIR